MKLTLEEQLGRGWFNLMSSYIMSKEFKDLGRFVNSRRGGFNNDVYPAQEDIFKAFRLCPLENLKCVVVGYEPYGLECDNGLAFGYNGAGPLPRTLSDIYRTYEIEVMDGLDLMFEYSLEHWAEKGILMLNLALTKEKGSSHISKWKGFSSHLLMQLNEYYSDIEYFFWDERALVAKSLLKNKQILGVPNKPFKEIEKLTDIKFKDY